MCVTTPASATLASLRARIVESAAWGQIRPRLVSCLIRDVDGMIEDLASGALCDATASGLAITMSAALPAFQPYRRT